MAKGKGGKAGGKAGKAPKDAGGNILLILKI